MSRFMLLTHTEKWRIIKAIPHNLVNRLCRQSAAEKQRIRLAAMRRSWAKMTEIAFCAKRIMRANNRRKQDACAVALKAALMPQI